MSFEVSLEEYGAVRTWPLKQGGESTPVTNENREEFVALYLDWVLNASIYRQFRAFYLGFHSVCASNALIVYNIYLNFDPIINLFVFIFTAPAT